MAAAAITLVGHDASRSGAPAALRSLLAANARPAIPTRLVLVRGGPLEATYRALVPTLVLEHGLGRAPQLAGRALASIGQERAAAGARAAGALAARVAPWRRSPADVVVANTLASLPTAATIAGRRARLVVYCHELDHVADRVATPGHGRLRARADHYVAAGPAVARMLVDRWHLDSASVTTIDEFVDRDRLAAQGTSDARRRTARDRLGLDADRPLVVSVGNAGPRKGTDLFIALMAALTRRRPDVSGIWVGEMSGTAREEATVDIAEARVGDAIRVVPSVDDPTDWYDAADVVVSTAREDPFPIVALEAAARGRAVAAFRSGGIVDVLDGSGVASLVAEAGDVLGLARRIDDVLDDVLDDDRRDPGGGPAHRRADEAGERLRSWVGATHLTDHWAPQWWELVAGSATNDRVDSMEPAS